MIKRIAASLAVFSTLFLVGAFCNVSAADIQPAVLVNGIPIVETAQMIDGTVYLPLRAVCEAYGYTVEWQETNGSAIVTVSKDGKTISVDLNKNEISSNGHTYFISDGCILLENRTYMQGDLFSENFGVRVGKNRQTGNVELTAGENPVSVTTMKVFSENDAIKISLQYPQISGLGDSKTEDGINAVFREAAVNAENTGLQTAYDLMKVKETYPDYKNKCETYFDYRIKYNRDGLLSVVLLDYQYSGGAHGTTVQTAYTFDLGTGKTLTLGDLMKSGSDYVSYISKTVGTEIDGRIRSGRLGYLTGSKFQTIGSAPEYYLSNGGAVLYFQQYAYFPYAAGIQEFTVNYSDLKDLLKPEFSFLCDTSGPGLLQSSGIQNPLKAGEIGRISLAGNPTTGYTWHCTVENSDIVSVGKETYTPDSDLAGAGGTYVWDVNALKKGTAQIVFKYYRDPEGEASAAAGNTVTYLITIN